MYTTSNRAERIAHIIEQRKPLAKQIEKVANNLGLLESTLDNLEYKCNQILRQVDDETVCNNLETINFSYIHVRIKDELQKLTKLKARFCRDTLNIGVVGRMRQGKSTLLQSLTGLESDVIPTHSGGACTAVKSIIRHRLTGETEAKIYFHSEESLFQEVILSYYQELNLNPQPSSFSKFINTFSNYAIPEVDNPTQKTLYERIKNDYHKNYLDYQDLLGKNELLVSRDEITEYVAHHENSFKNLAVRGVEIYCTFPNPEVGQIALVDLPGLGDFKSSDKSLLEDALEQEVDIVLFVRRPDTIGDAWKTEDTDLYATAARALNNLAERSFLVLNKVNDGQVSCQNFKDKILNGSVAFNVVDSLIADCSDQEQANSVLDRVIAHLENNITELDIKYAESCQSNLVELQQLIELELKKAQNALGKATGSTSEHRAFLPLFTQLWKDLNHGLETLLKQLAQYRDQVNIEFKSQVDATIQACRNDTGIPTIEEIEIRNSLKRGYSEAYLSYLNPIRAHLSQQFLFLDKGLKRSLDQVKCQVVEVLINQGRLAGLTQARGVEFLQTIAHRIPDEQLPGQPSKIKFGFEMLADFELSYRGLVQHRIRQHLDVLTQDSSTVLQLPTSPNAQQVLDNLKTSHAKALYKCQNALEDLLCEPSQAAFAIVEEFLDRILRAEDVEMEWQIYLDEVKAEVWSEFAVIQKRREMQQQWLSCIEQVAAANQLTNWQFIN